MIFKPINHSRYIIRWIYSWLWNIKYSLVLFQRVTLNDSIYADDISENKINFTIESLEYQEYQVNFVETSQVNTLVNLYFNPDFDAT